MEKNLPKGKGLYVWNIVDMPVNWVTEFTEMGITWIAVKIANGVSSSNRRRLDCGGWADDILEPFVEKARAFCKHVYGWQYVYMFDPETEAEKAAERVEKFDLDGFIIDAEHQCYGKHDEAFFYSKRLRELMPDIPIGLSTYRFPEGHPTLPYKEFLAICDFNAPQVYWNYGKAGQELAESYEQYLEIRDLPFIPAGRAYGGEGFPKPTPEEVDNFLRMAESIGCPAAFFWSADSLFHRLRPLPEIRRAIAEHEWIVEDEPEPEPVEIPPEDQVQVLVALTDMEIEIMDAITNYRNKIMLV